MRLFLIVSLVFTIIVSSLALQSVIQNFTRSLQSGATDVRLENATPKPGPSTTTDPLSAYYLQLDAESRRSMTSRSGGTPQPATAWE